jgi:hypothetical protein
MFKTSRRDSVSANLTGYGFQRFARIVPSLSKQGLPIHGYIHVASSTK